MTASSTRHYKRAEDYAYQFERLKPSEIPSIAPLLNNQGFGKDTLEYLQWKFSESQSESILYKATEGFSKEISAFQGISLNQIASERNGFPCYLVGETLVHSQHAKRGLFKRLVLQCANEVEADNKILYGIPELVSKRAFEKANFDQYGTIKIWEKGRSICRFGKQLDFDSSSMVVCRLSKAVNQGWKPNNYNVSSEYIGWFFEMPQKECLLLRHKDYDSSYILFRIVDSVIQVLGIGYENKEATNGLLAVLNRQVIKKGFQKMMVFSPSISSDTAKLRRAGFFRSPLSFGPWTEEFDFMVSVFGDVTFEQIDLGMEDLSQKNWDSYIEGQ